MLLFQLCSSCRLSVVSTGTCRWISNYRHYCVKCDMSFCLLVLYIENYLRSALVFPRADRTRCTATPSVARMVTLRSTTPTRSSVTTVNARRASAAKPSARTIHAPTTTLRWMGLTRYCATTPAAPPSCAATTVSHTPYVFVSSHDCKSETISLTSALLGLSLIHI